MNQHPVPNGRWTMRRIFWPCTLLATLAAPLSYLSSVWAILAMPLCALVSYASFDLISRLLFRKSYQPPARITDSEMRNGRSWSDWLLFVPEVFFFLNLMFVLGGLADCLHGTHVWKGLISVCEK
jgi:hypothetical protein